MYRPSLAAILVFAPDLGRARGFYTEVLGFEVGEESDAHLTLRGRDLVLHVFRCEEKAGPADGYARRPGSSVAFAVPDLDAAVARLRAHGVEVLHASPASGPAGRYVAFRDPFGTVHELVERVPESPPVGRTLFGNAVDASRDTRGWFLGHFMPGEDNPLRNADVEIKWFTHAAGERRPEWAPGNPVRTLNVLVRGHIVLLFPDQDVHLRNEGDFVLFGPGMPHSFRSEQESLVATIRWPSIAIGAKS